jgi:hypothetical protein
VTPEQRTKAEHIAWPHRLRFVGVDEFDKVIKSCITPDSLPTMHGGLAMAGYENVQDEDANDTFLVVEDRP